MLELIKSSYILKIIVGNLQPKTKLKIFKSNKVLLNRLNIDIKDFAKNYSEQLVIKKYDTRHLNRKLIDDLVLKHLDINKIQICDSILNLSDNKISNLEPLENINFSHFKKGFLYLSNNKITDIKILEKGSFKNLVRLVLSMNKIKDISIFVNINFELLEGLNLSNNEISNIDALGKANLKRLEDLYLHGNQISDINVFKVTKYEYLEILDLSKNKISNINAFKNNGNFGRLNHLNLSKNEITDINAFIDWNKNCRKSIDTINNPHLFDIENDEKSDLLTSRKIFGNLDILDLSQNKIIISNDLIKEGKDNYRFTDCETKIIIEDNNEDWK